MARSRGTFKLWSVGIFLAVSAGVIFVVGLLDPSVAEDGGGGLVLGATVAGLLASWVYRSSAGTPLRVRLKGPYPGQEQRTREIVDAEGISWREAWARAAVEGDPGGSRPRRLG